MDISKYRLRQNEMGKTGERKSITMLVKPSMSQRKGVGGRQLFLIALSGTQLRIGDRRSRVKDIIGQLRTAKRGRTGNKV